MSANVGSMPNAITKNRRRDPYPGPPRTVSVYIHKRVPYVRGEAPNKSLSPWGPHSSLHGAPHTRRNTSRLPSSIFDFVPGTSPSCAPKRHFLRGQTLYLNLSVSCFTYQRESPERERDRTRRYLTGSQGHVRHQSDKIIHGIQQHNQYWSVHAQ